MIDLNIDHNQIERRKQVFRDVFDYRQVDHIPIFIWVTGYDGDELEEYTYRSELESLEVQFEVNLAALRRSLNHIPDDYVPTVRITQGYMSIATMFGMDVYWGDDPNQPPGSQGRGIDTLEQVFHLQRPTLDDGIMPENLRRLRYFHKNLPPDVYLTGFDVGGPLNTLKDLLDTNLLYLAFYDNPAAVHHLLDMVTDIQMEIYQAQLQIVGGDLSRFAGVDFDPVWHPEAFKGFISDDVCATIGPDIFAEFSIPYNNRLFKPFGCGGLHNCGPNPCKHLYLDHDPKLKYFNCSYTYSHQDFPEMRELFSGWGLIEPMFDMGESAEDMLAGFRYTMESLAPDTIAIPICIVDDSWSDSDVTSLYWDMRKISEEYAKNMKWAESN